MLHAHEKRTKETEKPTSGGVKNNWGNAKPMTEEDLRKSINEIKALNIPGMKL